MQFFYIIIYHHWKNRGNPEFDLCLKKEIKKICQSYGIWATYMGHTK